MKDVGECLKLDVFRKPFPLPDTKVPKIKSILQLLKSNFINHPKGIPQTSNGHILDISLFQQYGILVLITQSFMSFTQLQLNLLFCVLYID
jgi:hypothetical protein